MIRKVDLYWLAGLLEGEGSFGFYPKGKNGSARIFIGMSDRDVIDRMKEITGATCNVFERVPYEGAKISHILSITGRRAAGIAMMVYPLMGKRRQQAIRAMLAEWKERPARTHVKYSQTRSASDRGATTFRPT